MELGHTPLFEPPTVCTIEQHEMYDLYNQSRSLATLSASPADRDFGGDDADAVGSTGEMSALYDLLLRQVIGKSVGYRGKNPLRHMGKAENYFKLYDEDTAYDYKYKTLLNALLYLAVRAGIRKIRQPYGSFSDEEILYTWIEAKEGGEIPSDDPAPNRAMNAAALKLGICEPSDIGEKQIGSGEDAFTLPNALSDTHYNETIRQFEGAFGVSAGRSELVSEEQFIVDGLTTDQSAEMFGELYLTTNPPEEMCHYDTPRIPVETVWKAYKAWCELNGVEYKREYDGGKKENASGMDGVEKKRARWKGKGIISVYNNAKLNSEGWWIYNNVA